MDKAKKMMDTMIDSQSKIMNNWVDASKKMQRAATDGQAAEKGTDLYNEWLGNQMSIFKNITVNDNPTDENAENGGTANVENYFKNWYNNQMTVVKQMTDFNQQMFSQMSNAGKSQIEINEQFSHMNKAWTDMYSNWTNTLNNTYENLSSTMKNGLNKDMFTGMYNSNNVFMKLYETFQPMMKGFQSNGFNADQLKNMMTAEFYKGLTEKMFESFFPKNDFAKMFETMQTNMKNVMGNSTTFNKEMIENWNNTTKNFPQLFMNSDMSKMMETSKEMMENINKPFAQAMKFMAPGKEKMLLENMVNTVEKINEYTTKQTQLQYLLYTTAQKAMEQSINTNFSKVNGDVTELNNFNQFFSEWVSTNENAFTTLFATDEFSQLKAEVTALSMGVKTDYDKQLEMTFENTPFAFKTDMDEVYKSVYDLKKMVKQMQKMLEINVEEEEVVVVEEKTTKAKKK